MYEVLFGEVRFFRWSQFRQVGYHDFYEIYGCLYDVTRCIKCDVECWVKYHSIWPDGATVTRPMIRLQDLRLLEFDYKLPLHAWLVQIVNHLHHIVEFISLGLCRMLA